MHSFLAILALTLAPATIRGHVYERVTGEIVQGANLRIHDLRRQESLATTSDDQGAFSFHVQPPEFGMRYVIECEKDGFARPDEVYPAVKPGEDRRLDFRMWRAAAVTGAVADEDGHPLSGVDVQAIQKSYLGVRVSLGISGEAKTDSAGHFRIGALAPGRYYIKADMGALNTKSRGYPPVFYPGASDWVDAQTVRVSSGEEYGGFQFKLPDAAAYQVRGKIVGPPGVMVGLRTETYGHFPKNETASGRDGSFSFDGLVPGRYFLEAGGNMYTFVPFEIHHANIDDLRIEVATGMSLRGVARTDDGPISRAEDDANPLYFSVGMQNPGWMSNDIPIEKDGTFEFKGLWPGVYDFGVNPYRQINCYVKQILMGDRDMTETGVSVPVGNGAVDISVTVDFLGGVVTGRVVDDADHPAADVNVALFSADPGKRSNARYFRSASTDANGIFRIVGIVPGDYQLLPWTGDPGEALDPEIFPQIGRFAKSITVERASSGKVDLRLTQEIRAAGGVR